ncbi:MAG: TRAP transporter substrate-binding protein DctP [Kiritimatiellae bacterium]|nr:TRAP transporter substrate-binding protein DctP [Kiritimatiellia bacterium]
MAACLLALAGALSAPAQVVIKLGTLAPEGSPWHAALLKLDQRWRDLSGGKVILRIYAGGVAGDEPDMLRKMKIGQLHAGSLTSAQLRTITPDMEAPMFPLLIQDDKELDYVGEKIRPLLDQQLESKGFKAITWANAGWVHFFSKEPVVTPADMQRRKLFFWGSDVGYVDLLKNSGFNPIPLAATDLLPSLQTGLVDSFAAPPTAALAFQWFALAPNMTGFRWQPLQSVTLITMRKWGEIPADLREPFLAAADEVARDLQKDIRKLEADAIAAMQKHGLKVHPVPAEALAEWEALVAEKGRPAFVGPRFSREMFERIESALAEYRSRAPAADTADPAP